MKYVPLLSASHNTKELLAAKTQPYLKTELAAEGVKILQEVNIEISPTNQHITNADPMQKAGVDFFNSLNFYHLKICYEEDCLIT